MFAPDLAGSAFLARLQAGGARIEREMRPLDERLAEASLFIHHGNAGAVAEGLAIGVPQLALPGDLEKILNGRQIAQAGVGKTVPLNQVRSLRAQHIEALSRHPGTAERAANLGAQHRNLMRDDPLGKLERACVSLLAG